MQSVLMNMLYLNLLMNLNETYTNDNFHSKTNTSSPSSIEVPGYPGDARTRELRSTSFPHLDTGDTSEDTSESDTSESEIENLQEDALSEVCYTFSEEKICFSSGSPWGVNRSRPLVETPHPPEEINTIFYLHSRHNLSYPKVLFPENLDDMKNLSFADGQKFKIIAHGFRSSSRASWVKNMVDELLRAADDIVIVTDWHKGALASYAQSAANIRVVGVQVTQLVYNLVRFHGVSPGAFHLIGHSLGAHLMGHCGARLTRAFDIRIPRISALDPAGPFFKDAHPLIRLDPSDAEFIDVIHTDNGELLGFPLSVGIDDAIGHLDFYPNGGDSQPKCGFGNVQCHHRRAIQLFTESIRQSCTFIGVVCESYKLFLKGDCWGCEDGKSCSPMGMKATPLPAQPEMTKLFLKTYGQSPYCGSHYRVTIQSRNENSSLGHGGEFAVIGVELKGARDSTGEILLSEKSIFYSAGSLHRTVILTNNVGSLQSIAVAFHYPGSIFNPMSWRIRSPVLHLHYILIEQLFPPQRWKFCFEDKLHLTSNKKYTLTTERGC